MSINVSIIRTDTASIACRRNEMCGELCLGDLRVVLFLHDQGGNPVPVSVLFVSLGDFQPRCAVRRLLQSG